MASIIHTYLKLFIIQSENYQYIAAMDVTVYTCAATNTHTAYTAFSYICCYISYE